MRPAGLSCSSHAELQPLRTELGDASTPAGGGGVLQSQGAAWPVHALAGAKAQVVAGDGEPVVRPLRHQPPLQFVQGQRGQIATELRVHLAQRQIGRDAGHCAVGHFGPGAQRALTSAHLHPPGGEVHVRTQSRHVHPAEVGVELAAPALPGLLAGRTPHQIDQRFAQLCAQAQALAPFGRRCRVQPELVLARGVARHKRHIAQRQRGLRAQVVRPAHRATLDRELTLGEKPVGRPSIALSLATQVQPGHLKAALRGAAHVQHRPVDHDLLEVAMPQRMHRHRRAHQRQVQGDAALRIEELDVAQLERRHENRQPMGALGGVVGPDVTHPNRCPYRAAGPSFQLGAPFADSGHNPPIQRGPGHHEQAPRQEHEPQTEPGCHRKRLEGSRGRSDRSRALIHVHRKL